VKAARYSESHATSVEFAEDWRSAAACRGHNPELWFPNPGELGDRLKALAICQVCPSRDPCLEEALDIEAQLPPSHRVGIYGGQTAADRGRILSKRKGAT
jgi:hypothetical protein